MQDCKLKAGQKTSVQFIQRMQVKVSCKVKSLTLNYHKQHENMNNVKKFFQYLFTCFQGCGCVKFVLKLNVSLVIRRRLLQPLQEVLTIFADFFFLLLLSASCFCTCSLKSFKSYQDFLKNILNYFWILPGLFLYSGIKMSKQEHLRCVQGPKHIPCDRWTPL